MRRTEIRQRWPEATDNDVERIIRYQRGDEYSFSPPDVSTALWDDLSWARVVTFKHTSYEDMKRELALFWDNGDQYGSLMAEWFPLAWVLEFERNGSPEDWHYRPGAGTSDGPEEGELMYVEIYRDVATNTLEHYGEVLNRLYRRLDARGDTY